MSTNADIVVVGGGPGGLEAATRAAEAGFRTYLVSALPAGGRATYGSLLPSKVWLHTAEEHAGEGQHAEHVTSQIKQRQQQWSETMRSRLDGLGVSVVQGTAQVRDRHHVSVELQSEGSDPEHLEIEARYIVIASGSEPIFFDGMRPDGERIIAPRHTQKLTEVPASMVMIGGGVTGCEYAMAFQKLGTDVHLVTDVDRLLPRTDPEISEALKTYFHSLGSQVTTSAPIQSVARDGNRVRVTTQDGTELEADYAFIATGRGPDGELLGDGKERPEQDRKGWILVDGNARTSLDTVYAVGDVTGPPLTANKAFAQARSAVRDIAQREQAQRVAPDISSAPSIEAVYTHPQVAHIGPVSELGSQAPEGVHLIRKGYDEIMLPQIHQSDSGMVKLWVDASSGEIRGASAFGEKAAEVLAPVQLAMQHGLSYEALTAAPYAHPTLTEILSW
jgi:dihydrolipoamide dehydrogenase